MLISPVTLFPQMRVTSFNIHGAHKIFNQPRLEKFLLESPAICLQESLDVDDTFEINGFAKFSSPATRVNGQPSGGMVTLLAHTKFGACKQVRIPCPYSWILPVHIREEITGYSLLLINVYFPRFLLFWRFSHNMA